MRKRKKPDVYGVPGIPASLRAMIEGERGNIANALSVLQCLSLAMDAQGVPHDGPFYPAVVEIAVQMLARTHNALDAINVEARLAAKPKPLGQ